MPRRGSCGSASSSSNRAGDLREPGTASSCRAVAAGPPHAARAPGRAGHRKEVGAALWPDDTFVDFDAGPDAVVNRIRRAR